MKPIPDILPPVGPTPMTGSRLTLRIKVNISSQRQTDTDPVYVDCPCK